MPRQPRAWPINCPPSTLNSGHFAPMILLLTAQMEFLRTTPDPPSKTPTSGCMHSASVHEEWEPGMPAGMPAGLLSARGSNCGGGSQHVHECGKEPQILRATLVKHSTHSLKRSIRDTQARALVPCVLSSGSRLAGHGVPQSCRSDLNSHMWASPGSSW